MRTKYQITSQVLGTKIQFTYSKSKMLVGFEVVDDVELDARRVAGILENALTLELLKGYAQAQKLNLVEVPVDLTFKNFWNRYNYKVGGSKMEAEKKWNGLSDADKVGAISYIIKYNAWLATKPGIDKQYASTYLNKQMWNN